MFRLVKSIRPEWLKTNGFHEIEADLNTTSSLLREDRSLQKLNEIRADDAETEMTHSVAINLYPATPDMPQLTIVVVDTIPVELKRSYRVWGWFVTCWLPICCWSYRCCGLQPVELRPIESLAKEVRELEEHHREKLNPETTRELTSLVRNLNRLLKSERERYDKYRTTLTDLTHSLKTRWPSCKAPCDPCAAPE